MNHQFIFHQVQMRMSPLLTTVSVKVTRHLGGKCPSTLVFPFFLDATAVAFKIYLFCISVLGLKIRFIMKVNISFIIQFFKRKIFSYLSLAQPEIEPRLSLQ